MTWLKIKFAVVTGSAVLATGAVAIVVAGTTSAPPSNPLLARQMLQLVFSRVSAPLPDQMRFVAETEIASKSWTETQIREEAKRIQDDVRKNESTVVGLRDEDLAKLPVAAKERRLKEQAQTLESQQEAVRWAHGTRTYVQQEWLAINPGGSLWRLDQTETTPKSEKLQAMYQPLPAGIDYEQSHFNIGDTNFISPPVNMVDNRLRSAWFINSQWTKQNFWEAGTLEPSVGFVLMFATGDMADFTAQAKAKPRKDIDSFAGIKLDADKLELLVAGKSPNWTVEASETVLNGRKLAVLRLKGRGGSFAHGEEIALFADAKHLTNICRIELIKMPLFKTPYISTRDDFDTNGFPHTWIVETPNDEQNLKRTVKFKEVDFHAQFDNKEIFTPEIPIGYQVHGRVEKVK